MSELSPETEELLARGREGTPLSASRRDELKGAVLAKLATGAIVTSSTSAAAWTMTTKTIGVAVIAAVVGTGTVGVVKYERHARAPQLATQTTQANQASNASNGPSTAPTPIMSASVNSEAPQTFPAVQPTLDTPPSVATNSPHTTNPNPTATSTSAPAISQASVGYAAAAISNGTPNSPNFQAIVSAPDPHVSSSGSSSGQSAAAPHASSLEEETTLLRSAHEALLAGDPARALRLLDEHATRFPSSALEPERSAERVFAFCAEQNTDAAHAAAGTFLSAHPAGPLASRVRASCGGR